MSPLSPFSEWANNRQSSYQNDTSSILKNSRLSWLGRRDEGKHSGDEGRRGGLRGEGEGASCYHDVDSKEAAISYRHHLWELLPHMYILQQ